MRYLNPSISVLVMGSSLTAAWAQVDFSWAMRLCSWVTSSSLFYRKVMMRGFWWKWLTIEDISGRWVSPMVMMELMVLSCSRGWLRVCLFCLSCVLNRGESMSARIWGVAMRRLALPLSHTLTMQNLRSVGFWWLQVVTWGTPQRYSSRAYLQTDLRLSTSSRVLGLTSPNLRVMQRLMGGVSWSPTEQKCVICSYSCFWVLLSSGGAQSTLMTPFIHSFLNLTISSLTSTQLTLYSTFPLFRLPANSSTSLPQPQLNRKSASGIATKHIASFSFFHRLLSCLGLPITMVLGGQLVGCLTPRSMMGSWVRAASNWWAVWASSLELTTTAIMPCSSLMSWVRLCRRRAVVLPVVGGAVMSRCWGGLSIQRKSCWNSVGAVS